jgi:hypothetical protein
MENLHTCQGESHIISIKVFRSPNVISLDYQIDACATIERSTPAGQPSRMPERQRKSSKTTNTPMPVQLLTTTETKDQMEGRLLLDVVVRQSATILQLLTSEDQSLLVRWNALLILDL